MKRISLIIICFAIACGSKKIVGQYSDKDINVLVQLKEASFDTKIFMVRIFPNKKIIEANKMINRSLNYHADSCFYLLKDNKKINPEFVEPVINGISGSFEFLIGFNNQNLSQKEFTMIYQDQIINKKKYLVIIK